MPHSAHASMESAIRPCGPSRGPCLTVHMSAPSLGLFTVDSHEAGISMLCTQAALSAVHTLGFLAPVTSSFKKEQSLSHPRNLRFPFTGCYAPKTRKSLNKVSSLLPGPNGRVPRVLARSPRIYRSRIEAESWKTVSDKMCLNFWASSAASLPNSWY